MHIYEGADITLYSRCGRNSCIVKELGGEFYGAGL